MRLHAYEHMHTPQFGELCTRAIILLDGHRVSYCIMADEERGMIEKYIEPLTWSHGEFLTEIRTGKVEILDHQLPEVIEMAYTRCDRG